MKPPQKQKQNKKSKVPSKAQLSSGHQVNFHKRNTSNPKYIYMKRFSFQPDGSKGEIHNT